MKSTILRAEGHSLMLAALVCVVVALGAPFVGAESGDENEGLVAYWPLDGDAIDHSGNGNNGEMRGPVPVAGRIGQALQFDGTDDEVTIGTVAPPLATVAAGPHSYSVWVFLTREIQPYPYCSFVVDALGDDQQGIRFCSHDPEEVKAPAFKWVTTTQSYNVYASTAMSLFEWHHIAGVYDGTKGRIYVDGVLSGELASTGTATPASLWKIGNVSAGGTGLNYFAGLIDEVRVYGRALSEDEVVALAEFSANAGDDQVVNEGDSVTLHASTTAENPTYMWEQIAGPSVTLYDTMTATPYFVAPELAGGGNQTLTFRLTVSSNGSTGRAFVNVTVRNVNHAPVANALQDQVVNEGSPVSLDATGSYDPDGDPIVGYAWEQTDGPSVTLQGPATAIPSFVAPFLPGGSGAAAVLTFHLTVSDDELSGSALVTVRVEQVNHPPVANGGQPQTVDEGSVVTLNGSASSDPDADSLSYRWTQVQGTPVVLSDSASAVPTFEAPRVDFGGETLTFRLVVTDGSGLAGQGDVAVVVKNIADPPSCDLARPSADVLWPPNHKMVPVSIVGVTDPQEADVVITVIAITQDEPINGLGDGDTAPDGVMDGPKALLRAERSGGGNGRVYRITFVADGGRSETCAGAVMVGVPHSAKKTPIDDEQRYDSTQP